MLINRFACCNHAVPIFLSWGPCLGSGRLVPLILADAASDMPEWMHIVNLKGSLPVRISS